MSQIHQMTTSPWGHSVVTEWCSPCEVIMMSLWYRNYDITYVTCVWGHCDMSLPHHHEVIVLSEYDVTETWDDYITLRSQCCHSVMSQMHEMGNFIMRSQCCHRMMFTMWGNYDVSMISELWHHMCDLFVRSLWYEFTTSPWGHSVITICFHRYMRWLHHHEVTVSSQFDVTDTRDDHIIMRSQCCHRTKLTMWDHYDIKIITSPVWCFCEVTVIQIEHITLRSHYCHSMMSQVLKVTTSLWGHSAVACRCSPDEVTIISSWYQNYDITCVRWLLGHSDKCLLHHHVVTVWSLYNVTDTQDDHIIMRSQCCRIVMSQIHGYMNMTTSPEITVLSQNDANHVMSLWCLHDIEIMTSHVWVVCEVTVTRVDHITMRP